ncbi:Protein of unknown function [Lactobacillus acidophilus DSM 9126]|nr:Protein of unknown function [Lactobacillus acidophilus DSM 20079 = JCM 1132 = NBRC 13951 = CIP 76.13]CDF69922.1 Protein of unknown function [Lactobacillus acidophilus CIRM-BIA 442]CDF71717.1 Protein of unknown function [Lactobacillus acidophilus CIRM-BIA 445]CDF73542.1 Protein of unknown function [Lactobacillus acidophilus DSM 9126]CDF75537.1 Protein of unknown function [Lactobacillus acidophilus DSM 20242]
MGLKFYWYRDVIKENGQNLK